MNNVLKSRLERGQPSLGCWLHLCSPLAAELVALAGYHAVLIDLEHGPGDLLNAVQLMQAVSATEATPVVRVPANDPVWIKRALDIGALGIMVPEVGSADEARAAVAACLYPPAGRRGVAYPLVRASGYGLDTDYASAAGDKLLVIAQIESAAGVANSAEIAAVKGIDMLFIGPFDLSAGLGKPGDFDDPEVGALLQRAEAAARASGKPLGGLPYGGRGAGDMVAAGYTFVTSGSDVAFLRDAARGDVQALERLR